MVKPFLPLFASLTLGIVANGAAAQADPALSLQVYNADAGSFHVNAVLVSGKTDAVLIDTGFTQADAHRSYVWIPSLNAIVGGVNAFAGLHVWTADTQSAQERADWNKKLASMAALHPTTVVPGHMLQGQKQDAAQLAYTQAYLTRFESELAKAPNAATLIA